MEAAFIVAIGAASENQENPFLPSVVRTAPGDILEAEKAMCSILEVPINFQKIFINFVHSTSHTQNITSTFYSKKLGPYRKYRDSTRKSMVLV